jgi:hypothetical protein
LASGYIFSATNTQSIPTIGTAKKDDIAAISMYWPAILKIANGMSIGKNQKQTNIALKANRFTKDYSIF